MAREIFSHNWDKMTLEEQREYRDRKLSHFVRTQLYPYSRFYRKVFDEAKVHPDDIRSVADLKRLPFTYKTDIAPGVEEPEKYREFILEPDQESIDKYMPRAQLMRMKLDRMLKGEAHTKFSLWKKFGPIHVQFTTGRTGLPTPVYYARDDMERMSETGRRVVELSGIGDKLKCEETVVINTMPFAPHLAFWMVTTALDRAGVMSLNSGGGRVLGTERIIAAIEGMNATAVVGIPGYVYHVLRTAAEGGRDLSKIKLILVGGERVPPGMKEKMAELLEKMGASDVMVLSALGFTEARKGYAECAPKGDTGYHLYPDLDYIELVDPESGEPVGEGEDGELVYTCLEGQGTCLIRFRTGDFVKGGISYEPCPSCGRTVPRLSSDICRCDSVKGLSLTKIKGTLVDQGAFFAVLDKHPGVEDWQVEIRKPGTDIYEVDELSVFIAAEKGADEEKLKEAISAELAAATEVNPNTIEFVSKDEMLARLRAGTGMKELRVVDKRPGC